MNKSNEEAIFQLMSVLLIMAGILFDNRFVLIASLIPLATAIWFWYDNTIRNPLKKVQDEIKEIHKDLNTRKELEDIRIRLSRLEDGKTKK